MQFAAYLVVCIAVTAAENHEPPRSPFKNGSKGVPAASRPGCNDRTGVELLEAAEGQFSKCSDAKRFCSDEGVRQLCPATCDVCGLPQPPPTREINQSMFELKATRISPTTDLLTFRPSMWPLAVNNGKYLSHLLIGQRTCALSHFRYETCFGDDPLKTFAVSHPNTLLNQFRCCMFACLMLRDT